MSAAFSWQRFGEQAVNRFPGRKSEGTGNKDHGKT